MFDLIVNPWTIIVSGTGLLFSLSGWILKRYPPKSINWLYGYRTRNSMKSQARWDFAQVLAGRQMIRSGMSMLLLGIPGCCLPLSQKTMIGLSIGIVLIFALLPLLTVEAGLKRHFREGE